MHYQTLAQINNILDIYKHLQSNKNNNIRQCKVILKDCLSINLKNETKIKKCGHPRCATCSCLNINTNFQSNVTSKYYKSFNPNMYSPLNCKSSNIIYLISCKKCGYQYVGQTTQEFSKRLNGHRKSVRLKNRLIGKHFSSENHSCLDMKVQIIEKIVPIQGESKPLYTKRLLEREDYWIREL